MSCVEVLAVSSMACAPLRRARHAHGSVEPAYDAKVFPAASWLPLVLVIPATLPPSPQIKPADAKTTKAISSVYSIKS